MEEEGDEGHIDEDPRELRDFLEAAFAWLSGHVQVPDTESLQYFIVHWKDVEKRPACLSNDADRRRCLDCIQNLFMSFEVVLQNLDVDPCVGWIDGGDRRWYNWCLCDFLATWKLQTYRASWRMSWRHVHLLFQQGVYK